MFPINTEAVLKELVWCYESNSKNDAYFRLFDHSTNKEAAEFHLSPSSMKVIFQRLRTCLNKEMHDVQHT